MKQVERERLSELIYHKIEIEILFAFCLKREKYFD